MQPQLKGSSKVDPVEFLNQHLKILKLQPEGRSIAPTHAFPSTIEDINLLKSLGQKKQILKLTTIRENHDSDKIVGVEITLQNGDKVALGSEGPLYSYVDLKEEVKRIWYKDVDKGTRIV